MRIRRIISLALCLVLVCLALVGCEEDIGAYRDKYTYKPEKVANIDFDLYIIEGKGENGEETTQNAKTTVNTYINTYLAEQFNSKITIHYLSEDEYRAQAYSAVQSSTVTGKEYVYDHKNGRVNAGKILLITDKTMMDDFVATEKLADLYSFVYNSDYNKLFGELKTQISEDLMEAAITDDDKLYAIPNNRIVGQYKYIVINREAALLFNYTATEGSELRSMTTLEQCEVFENYYYENDVLYYKNTDGSFSTVSFNETDRILTSTNVIPSADSAVAREVFGNYEYQKECEDNDFVCNISEVPSCTPEMAFESAFAIIAEDDIYVYDDANNNKMIDDAEKATAELLASRAEVSKRAMQIVNAINSDVYLRNLLQYGVERINYTLASDGVVGAYNNNDQNGYYMPIKYTGDIFKAYFNPSTNDNRWTAQMSENGVKHNNKENYYRDYFLKQ